MKVLLEIHPSRASKVSHLGLGAVSAGFAFLLAFFILWAGIAGEIGNWTIIILSLPVLLLAAVAWFVLKFGVDYVQGIKVYDTGLGIYYPLKRNPQKNEAFTLFTDIRMLYFEEKLEVHRFGNRYKQVRICRISAEFHQKEKRQLLVDMLNLTGHNILKFRELPEFLLQNKLILPEKIEINSLPEMK